MVYSGSLNENNEKHGYGVNIYDNGEVYEGITYIMVHCNV